MFDAIYYTVRAALEQDVTRPAIEFPTARSAANPKVVNAFVPVEEKKQTYKNVQMSFPTPTPEPIPAIPAVESVETTPPPEVPRPRESKPLTEADVERIDRFCKALIEEAERERLATEAKKAIETKPIIQESPVQEPPVQEPEIAPPIAQQTERKIPEYRILGEAFHSYVFVQTEDKLLIIDKHAAHERILFEELRKKMRESEKLSQLLMLPIEVMLTSGELQALEEYRDEIEAVGFQLDFKKHGVEISAIPAGIATDAVCDMLIVIADRIVHQTGNVQISRDLVFEEALYQASCKAAIKAGREYPPEHVKWLVDTLMRLPDITFCPHGRPIAMEMTKGQLDHQFERK